MDILHIKISNIGAPAVCQCDTKVPNNQSTWCFDAYYLSHCPESSVTGDVTVTSTMRRRIWFYLVFCRSPPVNHADKSKDADPVPGYGKCPGAWICPGAMRLCAPGRDRASHICADRLRAYPRAALTPRNRRRDRLRPRPRPRLPRGCISVTGAARP